MTKRAPAKKEGPGHVTKKCPECYAYIPLGAEVCPSCKTRVGKVGDHGMAERLTNWKAYIICALAWLVLLIYLKWAFF